MAVVHRDPRRPHERDRTRPRTVGPDARRLPGARVPHRGRGRTDADVRPRRHAAALPEWTHASARWTGQGRLGRAAELRCRPPRDARRVDRRRQAAPRRRRARARRERPQPDDRRARRRRPGRDRPGVREDPRRPRRRVVPSPHFPPASVPTLRTSASRTAPTTSSSSAPTGPSPQPACSPGAGSPARVSRSAGNTSRTGWLGPS